MKSLARRLAGLGGWRRFALALVLGAFAATALAPIYLVPALVVGFSGLLWLLDGATDRRTRFLIGWFFAWGHFIVGLYWIGEAFLVDAARFAWLLPFPVLGLPAGLALFPALAIAVLEHFRLRGAARAIGLGIAWTIAEWLRGHLLTGFPWNLLGYAWAFSDTMLQSAAVIGVYGLSLLTVSIAALPAGLGTGGNDDRLVWRWLAGAGAMLCLIAGFGAYRLAVAEISYVPGIQLRIVQGNIAQHMKAEADERQHILERYLQLSSLAGADRVTDWIWPETAVPYIFDPTGAVTRLLAKLADHGGYVFAGAIRRSPPDQPFEVWNSLQVVSRDGVIGVYDKRHLVPFGEFLPMRWLLGRLGLQALAQSSIDFSAGQSNGILELPHRPEVRALICYEAIFANEIILSGDRPSWLLNITNDAWFGTSAGPYQHFAAARARAIEQGLPLVRAANSGISALVDPYGRVIKQLGLGVAGVLDGPLPVGLPQVPLYGRFGDLILLLLLTAAAILTVQLNRIRSARSVVE